MANPNQYSYRPGMTRNVTRKWAEARKPTYDWDSDEEDDDGYGYGQEPAQQPLSQGQRSFTNPTINTQPRHSFDQGQEQRVFSAGANPPQHEFPAQQSGPFGGDRYYAQQPSPLRPEPVGRTSTDSRGSNNSARFPPRKSSLGQQEFSDYSRSQPMPATEATSKPLPFIRPADIYKRMEEEREKERSSQDSSRPSMDSIRRGAPEKTSTPSSEADSSRRLKPSLDTVAERKSEHLESFNNTPTAPRAEDSATFASPIQMQPINTNIHQAPSLPSGSSRYTDRPDPTSASDIDSRFPSRNVSQHEGPPTQRPGLPEITHFSGFGSDLFQTDPSVARLTDRSPQPPAKDSTDSGLQHKPSHGYRTIVNDAFQSQNQAGSPATTNASLMRTNTTSTSEISPIVGKSAESEFERASATDSARRNQVERGPSEDEEFFQPPRRLGTNRRDSASPARRPLSMEAPHVPEALSAIASPIDAPDTARKAQVVQPGAAALINQPQTQGSLQAGSPASREQAPHTSEASGRLNERTASEEFMEWSAARKEAHARHGIQDSNPPTPGVDSSGMPSPPVHSDPLNKTMPTPQGSGDSYSKPLPAPGTAGASTGRENPYAANAAAGRGQQPISKPSSTDTTTSPASNITGGIMGRENLYAATASTGRDLQPVPQPGSTDSTRGLGLGTAGAATGRENPYAASAVAPLPFQRPQVQRDESFRPILPGGWQSSTSIQKAEPQQSIITNESRPLFAGTKARTDSTDSIPTARAPRDANWRSQYTTSPQSSLAAAGSAMAGIFSGRAFTSSANTDSEVSSINEEDEDSPTGFNRDTNMKSRDFAATPPPPQLSEQSATRDFGASQPSPSDNTPKAQQQPFLREKHDKPDPLKTSQPSLRRPGTSTGGDSPTRESERWWSSDDEDAESAPAPAPLRTSRMGTVEPPHSAKSPVRTHSDSSSGPDADQLESDIVKSLTPKSSGIGEAQRTSGRRASPTRNRESQQVSPPFAAAALALSPGRESQALQEQNQFKPLSAPTSKPDSPQTGSFTIANLPDRSENISREPQTAQFGAGAAQLGGFTASKQTDVAHEKSTPTFSATKDYGSHNDQPLNTISNTSPDHADSALYPQFPSRSKDIESEEQMPGAFPGSSLSSSIPKDNVSSISSSNHAPETPMKDPPKPIIASSALRDTTSTPSTNLQTSTPSSPITPQTAKRNQAPIAYDSTRPFPADKMPIEKIRDLGTAQARIQAYNENRVAYTQPVGQLENWLSYMNTADNANVFVAKPLPTSSQASPSRPRYSSGVSSGGKQMQEDGKKLLASASKYGQKAGVLGKGLFSRGKEKLRTVSANQKGSAAERDRNASMLEVNRSLSYSNSSPPYLPTPQMPTPIDENSFSTYFSSRNGEAAPRVAAQPPFSPISEVSTKRQESTLGRSISAVSEDQSKTSPSQPTTIDTQHPKSFNQGLVQANDPTFSPRNDERSPQSGSTLKPQATTPARQDTTKSTGVVSDLAEDDQSKPTSAGLLASGRGQALRRDSSVSDVSSVSENDGRHRSQDQASGPISPPLMPTMSRDHSLFQSIGSSMPAAGTEQSRSQHVPSHSNARTTAPISSTKEAEAIEDREEEEQTLPRYSQAQEPSSRIGPGAQIVPIARIRSDEQPPRAEQNRPFSFAGSESILNYGSGTNRSIDTNLALAGSSNAGQVNPPQSQALNAHEASRGQAPSPLPSAGRNPEDFARRTPEEFARIRQHAPVLDTQPKDDNEYRIPGPYGQELRSPRPKASSPLLEELRTGPTHEPADKSFSSALPTANAFSAAAQQEQPLPMSQIPGGFPDYDAAAPGPVQHRSQYVTEPYLERVPERERARSRPSKLSSIFRSRSKSRSRLQKENSRDRRHEERPDSGRRNSLFGLGGRTRSSENTTPVQPREEHGEFPYQHGDDAARPGAGTRRRSKDLFKGSTFSQPSQGQAHYGLQESQPRPANAKKKRFSGLFSGKSQERTPTRSSTLPSNSHPMPRFTGGGFTDRYHEQVTSPYGPERPPQIPDSSMHDEISQQQQPFGPQPAPAQSSQGMSADNEGYFGAPSDTMTAQGRHQDLQHQPSHTDQQSMYSNPAAFRQQVAGNTASPYQHENLPYQHEQGFRDLTTYPQQHQRPDLPHLDTGDRMHRNTSASAPVTSMPNQYTSVHSPIYAQSPNQQVDAPTTTRAYRDISHGDDRRQGSPSPYGQISNEPSRITPRVAALHTRSRSPKLGRRSSEDLNAEFNSMPTTQNQNLSATTASPVAGLGTFNSKKVSPAGGVPRSSEEQEKPWAISLPEDERTREREASDPASATSSKAREMRRIMLERQPQQTFTQQPAGEQRPQTVAEKFMGHGQPTSPPLRSVSPSVTISRNSSMRGKAPVLSPPVPALPTSTVNGSGPAQNPFDREMNQSMRTHDEPVSFTRTSMDGTVSRGPSQHQGKSSSRIEDEVPAPGAFPTDETDAPRALHALTTSASTAKPPPALPPRSAVAPMLAAPPPVAYPASFVSELVKQQQLKKERERQSLGEGSQSQEKHQPTTTNEAGASKIMPKDARHSPREVHEMPGSRPVGYESDEEPEMSATAYPGQEWQPVFERWED